MIRKRHVHGARTRVSLGIVHGVMFERKNLVSSILKMKLDSLQHLARLWLHTNKDPMRPKRKEKGNKRFLTSYTNTGGVRTFRLAKENSINLASRWFTGRGTVQASVTPKTNKKKQEKPTHPLRTSPPQISGTHLSAAIAKAWSAPPSIGWAPHFPKSESRLTNEESRPPTYKLTTCASIKESQALDHVETQKFCIFRCLPTAVEVRISHSSLSCFGVVRWCSREAE